MSKTETGVKFDESKPPLHLIPYEALEQIARGLEFGREKYGEYNWRKGIKWSRVLSAAMRHLHAFNAGESIDPETGLSHLALAGCNIMFLLTYQTEHPELDDRYDPQEKS